MPLLKPGRIFLILSVLFGYLLVFLTPPIQVPDEQAHFYRAFQIAEGQFISVKHEGSIGGFIPVSLVEVQHLFEVFILDKAGRIRIPDIRNALRIQYNEDDRIFVSFPNTANYSPVPYLPQAVGIGLGRLLGLPPLILLYLGRIGSVSAWIVMICIAIYLIPLHKWLFVLLALTPMSIFEAASLSADAATNGLAFLSIAIFMKISFDGAKRFSHSESYVLIIITVLLSLSKNAYFLTFILFFLIPPHKFDSTKARLFSFGSLMLANILALAVWSSLSGSAETLRIIETRMCPTPGVDHSLQLKSIISNPFNYIVVLARTATFQYGNLARGLIGNLGWLDTPIPDALIWSTYLIILFFSIFETRDTIHLTRGNRLILGIFVIGSTFITVTLLYLAWTAVGARQIDGLQGRYFIPILPALLIMLHNHARFPHRVYRVLPAIASAFLVGSLLTTSMTIARRYYDLHRYSGFMKITNTSPIPICEFEMPVEISPGTGFSGIQSTFQIGNVRVTDSGMAFSANGTDPQLLLADYSFPDTELLVSMELTVPSATRLQIFYTIGIHVDYSESESVCVDIPSGRQKVVLVLPKGISGRLRMDPGKTSGEYVLHSMDIRSVSPSLPIEAGDDSS